MNKKDFDRLMDYKFNLKPLSEGKDEEGNTYYSYSRPKNFHPLSVSLYSKDIEDDKKARAVLNTIKRKLELGEY